MSNTNDTRLTPEQLQQEMRHAAMLAKGLIPKIVPPVYEYDTVDSIDVVEARTLWQWQAEAHRVARTKGFVDTDNLVPMRVAERIAQIHGELSEALDIVSQGKRALTDVWFREQDGKPEGFGIELADVFLRLMHLADVCNIDMEYMTNMKHEFNKTRPYMHGKVL